jgi:hypothetical protein
MALSLDETIALGKQLCDFSLSQGSSALNCSFRRYLNYVLNAFPLGESAAIVSRLSVAHCRESLAILYYDYALTFAREVEYFWPNPYRMGSWVSAVFFLNRYFAIFGHIPILIGLIPRKSSCKVGAAVSSSFF